MKKIVIIGGGTGTFTLLQGLRQFPTENSVIVSTADDGGSTGRLRKDYGVLPPGDLRQCLIGLSYTDELLKQVFAYRFNTGELAGHSVGNILLSAAQLVSKDSQAAINLAARILNVRGEIIPVTLKPTQLSATLKNGKKIVGEHNIDEPKGNAYLDINSLNLSPAPANKEALNVIREADAIVFGPGDLFTSIVPNILVKDVRDAVLKSKAKKIFVTSIMTKHGQTKGFKAVDFVTRLEAFLDPKKQTIDTVIINTQIPSPKDLSGYKKSKAEFVKPETKGLEKYEVIKGKFVMSVKNHQIKGDKLNRSLLRHNSQELAKIVWELIK